MFTCTQATSDGIHWGDPSFLASLAALSYAFHWRTPSTFVNDYRILGQWGSTSERSNALICVGTTGTFRWYTYSNSATKFARVCNTDLSASTLHRIVATYDESLTNANAMDFYWNGASKGDGYVSLWDAAPAALNNGTGNLYLGRGEVANASPGGDFGEFACWNRKLTAAEAIAVSNGAAPTLFPAGLVFYAPLRNLSEKRDIVGGLAGTEAGTLENASHGLVLNPAPVFYSFPAAAGAGVQVDVPAGTLTITGQLPSISTGVQVSAPAGSLALQGYVPAIQTGVSVAVPAGSLAITGQVPSISTGVSVAVPAGSLAIQGYVPTITTVAGVSVAVPAGTLTITGQVPTVSTGVSVAVPAGALTIQGYAPSLSMGVSVAVPAGSLAIQGYAPTIETGVSVAVPVGALTITGQVPTVTAGAVATTVSVPVGTLTITGYAPLVTSYLRSGLLAQIHTDVDGYLNTYDNLSKVVTHNAVDYRGVFNDVSSIGLQGGTNARDGPWVVMKSDDVDGTISYGDTVTIYGKDWTVEGIQPDGTGTSKLILIPAP